MKRGCLLVLSLTLCLRADTPAEKPWELDVIHRKMANPLRGLILEDARDHVTIRCVSQKPGAPTLFYTVKVPRHDVVKIDELTPEKRTQLKRRIETIQREYRSLIARLRALETGKASATSHNFTLEKTKWIGDDKITAHRYRSTHFELIANTRPELTQLAAIELEQIYAAYERTLPPRTSSAQPTTILLTRSLAEYHKIALDRGLKLVNPAFYDPQKNQVVCGSDLDKLYDEMESIREHHVELRAKIRARRAELAKIYRNKTPTEILAPMLDAERRIGTVEKRNEMILSDARDKLFQQLYHEAFHAYLGSFVYPSEEGSLPLWFNEGLAQIFETAIVEAGEMRVRHAHQPRLAGVRAAIADKRLMPLHDLLRSTPRDFQMAHVGERQTSDRHYLAAWALAFYLTFDQGMLGTKPLDDYVASLKRGTDPVLAFRDLVGKPLSEFEKEYQDYLGRLRPDGTAPPRKTP